MPQEFINASCISQSEIPQEAWDICGIEELDCQFEIEWELSNEESYWDPFEDYVPW